MEDRAQRNRPIARVRSPEQAFGRVLRGLRAKQSISQEALAHTAGYHRTYIGQLERGEKSPSLETIFALTASLSVSPSEMIREIENVLRKSDRLAKTQR